MEDGAGQGMATFSPVQLDQRGATFGLIVEVRQRVDCLVDPSELRERLRQARWLIPHLQRAHDTGGRYAPEFQRADRPQHIVPLWGDSVEVDGLACHAVKRAVVGPGIDPPEAGTADVGEPRTEAVAEQAEETEHHIRVGPGVGHDLRGLQLLAVPGSRGMGLGEQWNRKYGRRLDLGPPE